MSTPKIIHQTWKTKDLSGKYEKYSNEWKALHPNYQYILYDDEDLLNLVKVYFPDYLNFYKNTISSNIERVDFARYIMLYAHGGIYADIDTRPVKSFDPLLIENKILIGEEPKEHTKGFLCNAIMVSPLTEKSKKFWSSFLKFIVDTYQQNQSPIDTTGPNALRRFFVSHPKFFINNVDLISPCYFTPVTNNYTDNTLLINSVKLDHVSEECMRKKPEVYAAHLWDNTWVKPRWSDPRWKNKTYWVYAISFFIVIALVIFFTTR